MDNISAELISSLAGVLLSLAFAYVPPFRAWFDELEGSYKRLIMLAGGALVALTLFGLSCAGVSLFGVEVSCSKAGALQLVQAFLSFMVANQATYTMLPKPVTYTTYIYHNDEAAL